MVTDLEAVIESYSLCPSWGMDQRGRFKDITLSPDMAFVFGHIDLPVTQVQ